MIGTHSLQRTRETLREQPGISVPQDNRRLVELATYTRMGLEAEPAGDSKPV